MNVNQIVIFDKTIRMNIQIDEATKTIGDVTLIKGSEDTELIMNVISHKSITDAIKDLSIVCYNNKYLKQVIDILNTYN